jgi:hypothetical protein
LAVKVSKAPVPFAHEPAIMGNSAATAFVVGIVASMSMWLIAAVAHTRVEMS